MNRYTIKTGEPTWHQKQAGGLWRYTITLDQTPKEHEAYLHKLRKKNESYLVVNHGPVALLTD